MFIRKYWIPMTVFLVVIVGVGLYYLQTRPPKDPIVIIKTVEPIEQPKAEVSKDGHFHTDGTWHEGPHKTPPDTTNYSTDSLTSAEKNELYRILRTEGFKREKLSEKQLLYLSRVGLHWDYLLPEQQTQLDREYYAQFGLNPPPKEYRYSFQDVSKGILNLDEEGNAIIVKIDDPLIKKSFGGHLLNVSK